MRIYDGSPRQNFEEVFRSIGAFLDQRGMREVLLVEVPDGFLVQGLVMNTAGARGWSESFGTVTKETLTFLDDDIARFMEEAAARRAPAPPASTGGGRHGAIAGSADQPRRPDAGYYESAFRVIGRYIDEQKPRDVFFLEQDGAFVVRLLMGGQAGQHHALAEFTRDDLAQMIARAPELRQPEGTTGTPSAAQA